MSDRVIPYPYDSLNREDAVVDLAAHDLSDTDLALRNLVREVVDDVIAPAATAVDQESAWPSASLKALGDIGVLGLLLPERFGGAAGTTLQYVLTVEEVARGCAASAAVYMTQAHAGIPILSAGSPEQQERWLPQLADGSAIGAIALTEPGAGSDLSALTTQVREVGAERSIVGAKTFITNGGRADLLCVLARESSAPGHRDLSVYVVEGTSPGLRRGRPLKKMGIRGSETVELWFDEVPVGDEQRLGARGDGWRIVMKTLESARLSTAAQALGIAQGAYQRALRHARERKQFGAPIFDFQAVQFRIVDMAMQIATARAFLHQVARAIDAGQGDVGTRTAMAKVVCSDLAMRVTTDAVQVLGGYGYLEEYEVERMMRDAKITQIYDGTNDINRMVVARGL